MHFDEALRQCKTDPKTSLRLSHGTADLSEHLEHLWQHLWGDTNAGIPNGDDRRYPVAFRGYRNLSCRSFGSFGVLGGIVEKVRKHLSEPDRVPLQVNGVVRQGKRQFLPVLFNKWPARFKRRINNGSKLYIFFSQFERISGDAIHIEKIVDQT